MNTHYIPHRITYIQLSIKLSFVAALKPDTLNVRCELEIIKHETLVKVFSLISGKCALLISYGMLPVKEKRSEKLASLVHGPILKLQKPKRPK